ncbi:hypothetical protein [Amycolatopsis anabasis]|uniref:hypothetical protein n=1 Tax=Amycolatopsis anabasis TaxID=1840409 RepID=UPI00131AF92D|nr:hypothetical protein [Amycolatopsis anabasis]
MTAALRLPDPFTPGATSATAATPTCSCCCCCCAVSVVSASVALPRGFARDLRAEEPPRRNRFAMVLLALVPGLTLVLWYLLVRYADLGPDPGGTILLLGFGAAIAAVTLITAWSGPLVWILSFGRILLWIGAGILEFLLVLFSLVLGPLALVPALGYVAALGWLPRWLNRRYKKDGDR